MTELIEQNVQPIAVFMADLHWTTLTPAYRKEHGQFNDVIAKKLKTVFDYACKEHNIPIFVAGDLFDRSREFLDMWTLRKFLFEYVGHEHNFEMYATRGQHDMFHHNSADTATNFNAIYHMFSDEFLPLDNTRSVILQSESTCQKLITIYGCGWNERVSKPDEDSINILLWHKGLWRGKSPYPGAKDGNVESISVQLKELGYDIVFAGDYHTQWDAKIGGVRFYNLGCFTRKKVNETDLPRFCVLYNDLSVKSVHVGESDVFHMEQFNSDKKRGIVRDEFSDALAISYDIDNTMDVILDAIIASGKCNDIVLNKSQLDMLKDARATGKV